MLFHDDHAPETFPGGITVKEKEARLLIVPKNFVFSSIKHDKTFAQLLSMHFFLMSCQFPDDEC